MQTQEQAVDDRRKMPEARPEDETLLTSSQVCARYGGVSTMCLWRWVKDERVAFPQPEKINNRNYWRLGVLRQWDATRPQRKAA